MRFLGSLRQLFKSPVLGQPDSNGRVVKQKTLTVTPQGRTVTSSVNPYSISISASVRKRSASTAVNSLSLLTTYRTTYYIISMLKTYLYIPEQLNKKLDYTAKVQHRSKAEVIRQALENGIGAVQQQGTASAEVLLKIAKLGKKYHVRGPGDSSARMDEYLWDKDWTKDE